MTDYTLSRADVCTATGWRYRRVRTLIETPYLLRCRYDPPSQLGGGRTGRFRLTDILIRAKAQKNFQEDMGANLIAADAAYRKGIKT